MKVPIFVLTEKPRPETDTVIPFGPWEGARVIEGVVAVNAFEVMKLAPVVPCDTST